MLNCSSSSLVVIIPNDFLNHFSLNFICKVHQNLNLNHISVYLSKIIVFHREHRLTSVLSFYFPLYYSLLAQLFISTANVLPYQYYFLLSEIIKAFVVPIPLFFVHCGNLFCFRCYMICAYIYTLNILSYY